MKGNKMQKIEELQIKRGTIIKFQGIPFELKENIIVLGLQSNLELAENLELETKKNNIKNQDGQ